MNGSVNSDPGFPASVTTPQSFKRDVVKLSAYSAVVEPSKSREKELPVENHRFLCDAKIG